MKTELMKITSRGEGMEEALSATEKLGADSGLSGKENLRLRLMAEELVGLLRGIAGNVEADYQVEENARAFALHLTADVMLDMDMRQQLLDTATSGKNSAARGFMGKIREMIAVALLPDKRESVLRYGMTVGMMNMGNPYAIDAGTDAFLWSMNNYRAEVEENRASNGEAAEAWDELERSIVANLADEVIVRIVGNNVEITITKTF